MIIEILHCIGATVATIENLSNEYDTEKLQFEIPSKLEGMKPIVIETENVYGSLYNRG